MTTAAPSSSKRSRIAVVGGGAAGVLTAAQLRRRRDDAQITLIDVSGRPGTGAAYGTPDPTHLLNVPAPRMSAFPDDPDHFTTWLDEHAVATFDGFAPRSAYGRYLLDVLRDAEVRLETAEVVRLEPGPPSRLTLSDGRVLAADAVALATGRPPGTIPESLERALGPALMGDDARVVVDPWEPGALVGLAARKPERVLVIGSGLTGVDVALHLVARGSTVTLLSRHGEMPRRFRSVGPPTDIPNVSGLPEHPTLDQLRQAITDDVAAARANACDWRQVIDALRPHTASLWRSLGWPDQRRFLREDLRAWEVLRHRMPPAVADAIDEALESGALSVQAGELVDARAGEEVTLVVATADGSVRHHVDAVVVAAGTAWDRRALAKSRLWGDLLDRKIADWHPSGIGVRVHESGYLIDAAGGAVSGVVCIGAIRQGELWESTAIPEIRSQAAAIAEVLAEKQPVPVHTPATTPRSVPRRPTPTLHTRKACGDCSLYSRARRLRSPQPSPPIQPMHAATPGSPSSRPNGPTAPAGRPRWRVTSRERAPRPRAEARKTAATSKRSPRGASRATRRAPRRWWPTSNGFPMTSWRSSCSRRRSRSPAPAMRCPTRGTSSSDSRRSTARRRGISGCALTDAPNRGAGTTRPISPRPPSKKTRPTATPRTRSPMCTTRPTRTVRACAGSNAGSTTKAATSGTGRTSSGTPRSTSWRWATPSPHHAATPSSWRRRSRTACGAWSTPVRSRGVPACIPIG